MDGDKIKNIKFLAEGCVLNRGTASVLCHEFLEKEVDEILEMVEEDVHKLIDQVPSTARKGCVHLPLETIQKALKKHKKKGKGFFGF